MEINKDLVSLALKENLPVHFEGVFQDNYSWENFINFINYAIKQDNPNAIKTDVKETIGYVNFWQKLTMTLDNTSDEYFPGIEEKHLTLQSFIDKPYIGRFGAVSLTDSEPTTGKHSDPITVIYWNCIGVVEWKVYTEIGEKVFILNPGDVILVPKDIVHEVKSLSPRAAISFMFGDKDE